MSIPNWPPPLTAITYTVHCKSNYVYRVESAEILSELPNAGAEGAYLLGSLPHLDDALESLGVDKVGAWAGYGIPVTDSVSRVIAWAVQSH